MQKKTWVALLAAAVVGLPAAALAQHMHGAGAGSAAGTVKAGVRTIEMAVTSDGFVPAEVKVKKGEKVRLQITRKTDKTCATEIVVKDYGINTPLPLNKTVTVEFTPTKTGSVRYACGMDMISGTLVVE